MHQIIQVHGFSLTPSATSFVLGDDWIAYDLGSGIFLCGGSIGVRASVSGFESKLFTSHASHFDFLFRYIRLTLKYRIIVFAKR